MSRAMTINELSELYHIIMEKHSPLCGARGEKVQVVKYIDPHIDMRDGRVFAISFRRFGGEEHCIHTQNECRELNESLFERCVAWLNTPMF